MLLPSVWRRTSVCGVAALALGVCLLTPAAAGAHRRASLESAVGEEAAAAALGESSAAGQSSEAAPPSRREEREQRRQARSERAEERRQARSNTSGERRAGRADLGCAIELQAPHVADAGVALSLAGTLSCAESTAAADQAVSLYRKLARTPGFTLLASAVTEADGAFKFAASQLEGNSVFYATAGAARSARTRVSAAPAVTISAPAAGALLPAGGRGRARSADAPGADAVTFSGTLSPATASTNIALEQEFRGGGWHRIAFAHVDEDGSFSIVHSFSRTGQVTLRVLVRSHGRFITSASAPVTYLVTRLVTRHRVRPITIQTSPEELAYGSSLSIAGTVAGPAEQPLTLFAQTKGGAFEAIATGTSSANEYSFSAMPLQSTRYRVASASASSAVVTVTPTYALTPTPAPASAVVGEALTFTGIVAPAQEQTVDLERESLSGVHGYHVLASATVSPTGSYSIGYTFPALGQALLRISVRAGTDLGSTASQPFELQVTSNS